jgi:hypothetical protein
LRKLKDNPYWVKFIVGGILADGSSLWEELQPIKQLLEEFQNDLASGNGDVFFAEVLNDENAGLRAKVDINAIPENPYITPLDIPQGRIIIVDPAGEKKVNDLNAVGYFEVFDGKPVFQKVVQGHWNPLQLITQAVILALTYRCSLICVENIAYQASLLFWFEHICAENNLNGLFFEPISPNQKSKNSRIKDMLKTLVKTDTSEPMAYLGRDVIALFKHQIISWDPLILDNTDELLDLAAYANQALLLYGDQMMTEFNIDALEFSTAKVLPASVTSPF